MTTSTQNEKVTGFVIILIANILLLAGLASFLDDPIEAVTSEVSIKH